MDDKDNLLDNLFGDVADELENLINSNKKGVYRDLIADGHDDWESGGGDVEKKPMFTSYALHPAQRNMLETILDNDWNDYKLSSDDITMIERILKNGSYDELDQVELNELRELYIQIST